MAINTLPIIGIRRLRMGSDGTGIRTLIGLYGCPLRCRYCLNGDIKSVQGNTGHAVSNMVTDVYSHIFDASRRHMAKQVDEQFFAASEDKNNCTP